MTATGRPLGLKTRGRPERAMRVRSTLRAPYLFAQLTGIGIPRCLKRSGFPVRIRGWAPDIEFSPSWTNRESRRVQTAEPRKAYCQFESGRGDQGFALCALTARPILPHALSLNSAPAGQLPSNAPFPSVARMVSHPPSKRDFMRIRLPPDGPPFRDCLGVVVAQRPRAPRCDRGKHGFESH